VICLSYTIITKTYTSYLMILRFWLIDMWVDIITIKFHW